MSRFSMTRQIIDRSVCSSLVFTKWYFTTVISFQIRKIIWTFYHHSMSRMHLTCLSEQKSPLKHLTWTPWIYKTILLHLWLHLWTECVSRWYPNNLLSYIVKFYNLCLAFKAVYIDAVKQNKPERTKWKRTRSQCQQTTESRAQSSFV